MKIAVPTRGNVVDDHFGHCEKYTLYTIDGNKKIESTESLSSPEGCGCKSNIGQILQQKGVNVLLAGNMGDGALRVLKSFGIDVIRGNSGDARQVVEAFLMGTVSDSGHGCQNHGDDHQCGS